MGSVPHGVGTARPPGCTCAMNATMASARAVFLPGRAGAASVVAVCLRDGESAAAAASLAVAAPAAGRGWLRNTHATSLRMREKV